MLRNKQNDIDMNSNKNIPQLRFPGFTGEWEEKKIGEIADVLQGYGFPDKYQGQKIGDLPFCKVGDISSAVDKSERYLCRAANYINYSLLSTLHAKPIPVGATVFAKIGEAIRNNKKIRTSVPCLIDNNAAAVKATNNEIDDFMFYLMSKINLADYSGGIVPSVNKSTIEAIPVLVPSTIKEQKKISSFLLEIDNLIILQAQKVDALKEKKKGMMQQMFPQKGETTPCLRFPGFTGDWNGVEFGSIITEYIDKTTTENEDILLSSAIDGLYLNSELFTHFRGQSNIGYRKVKRNMLILSAQNLHLGNANVNLRFETGIISPAYKVYYIHNCDPVFLSHWIKREEAKTFFENATTAGASVCRKNIVWKELYKQIIYLPTDCSEQQKIAECLSAMDDMIASESAELDALKDHKKGLMQQLFPQPNK